ncbi:hypothetical protein D915_008591 [Fasciola hepatica]|uniref:Ashwin n=1 Tax=Fasciola hepatica TaxID=6192 RepID=A0A2H1BYD2_FASHE|nr:hypothetical protein D915_008591 [Fasciola hepatica]
MKNVDLTDFAAPEYLPESKTYVDLLQPEGMSRAQILELFSRRGFASKVSPDDAFHLLVDLYYDHIMPMPQCSERSSNASSLSGNLQNGESKGDTSFSKLNLTKRSVLPSTKRLPETRLEDLVITSDPKRITPGYSTPEANRAERVLTVRKPKGPDSRALSIAQKTYSVAETNEQTNSHCHPLEADQTSRITFRSELIPKKRVKLKRDFTSLV